MHPLLTQIFSSNKSMLGNGEIDTEILSDLLSDFFNENIKKDKHIDLLRDDNLKLKTDFYHMAQNYDYLERKYKEKCVQLHERHTSERILLKRDSVYLQTQTQNKKLEISGKNKDLKHLKHIRDRCTEMEIDFNKKLEMQRVHYDKIIIELTNDLESLATQLMESQHNSLQNDILLEGSLQLENSFKELETQNDKMQKSVEQYERQLIEAETKLKHVDFENNNMRRDIIELRSDLHGKDNKIEELLKENEDIREKFNQLNQRCKCKENNHDKDNLNYSRQNQLLIQKTGELERATETIKRLNGDLLRMRKITGDEKKRLTDEQLELIDSVGQFKCKLAVLEKSLEKRDKDVTKLNEKLFEAAQKEAELQTDLKTKTEYLTRLENTEYKLRGIIEDISEELADTKSDQRHRANKIMSELNSTTDNITRENSYLKNELYSVKEKLATMEGRDHALSDLLRTNQEELNAVNKEMHRLSMLENEILGIKDKNLVLYRHNSELVEKYQELKKEYNLLKKDYENLSDLKDQTVIALENARKWQEENNERERIINSKITKQSEHINTLLEDRKSLISKIHDMHNDAVIINSELDKYKKSLGEMSSSEIRNYLPTFTINNHESVSRTKIIRYNSDSQLNDSDPQIVKRLKHMTKKMYRTRKFWQNAIQDAIQ